MFFRIAFIALLPQYISPGITWVDIATSIYYGGRISLKSAGIAALLSFIFCTLINVIRPSLRTERLRRIIGYTFIFTLTLLFAARLPYYKQFHTVFSPLIFNTFRDDVQAIISTLVKEYDLIPRLAAAIAGAVGGCWLLAWWLNTRNLPVPRFTNRWLRRGFRTVVVLAIAWFMVFARFGGSLGYAGSVHWHNAAVTRDEFLNEAVLDDVQALYRAWSMHKMLAQATALNLTATRVANYAANLTGKQPVTANLDDYLRKEADGALIPRPRHIFLIVGESYAAWPLLPEYDNLHIADGLKNIAARDNAACASAFVPAGHGTMSSLGSLITGLAEVNLYPNYQPETYRQQYPTALAVQMKRLGYKTYFWYGGFPSWQRIRDFALAQGFDAFYGAGDIGQAPGNAWGIEDKFLFEAIERIWDGSEPSFHLILTISNHPPYTVDLAKEGFSPSILPETFRQDKAWLAKLGHFWYADKVLADFVDAMYRRYPDSLFAITGDHADRMNIEPNPPLFVRYAVPLVLYGQGIHKNILPQTAYGSHLDIAPTLIELIAPRGFVYYSLGRSLTHGAGIGIGSDLWVTYDYIGRISTNATEHTPYYRPGAVPPDKAELKATVDAVQAVSWWRVKMGSGL
ncbi:LTA synthase family protein [Thermosinus carboxydivorans]|nr:alkaline phosphatase family protein [Thermosinus carboxydivorans]